MDRSNLESGDGPFESAADTSTLEHEIDQHVYQLYQLTPDEIATIESNQ